MRTTSLVIFNSEVLNYNIGELMQDINELLNDIAPEGKDESNFTGGYVQQLKNSNRFTAFFGVKEGTTNKQTVQIDIPDDEVDLMFLMLKAKIHQMKNARQKVKKISLAQRKLDKLNREAIDVEVTTRKIVKPNKKRIDEDLYTNKGN